MVQALDRLGIHYVEAGFPTSNPKEAEPLSSARRGRAGEREGLRFRDDPPTWDLGRGRSGAHRARRCIAPVCTLVGKTWALHLDKVTRVTSEEDLRMITDSVGFLRAAGKRVVYDAEHFFDGWRDDAAYAQECLAAAVAAGAENVTLCDTNGSSLPAQVAEATVEVVDAIGRSGRGWDPRAQRQRVRGRQLPRRRSRPARGSCRGR